MMNKELKRLSRRELVDVIYQMKKNEQQLQEEIAALQDALQEKRIRLSVAGSVADAATSITNLLTTAQSTADLYLEEIAHMKADAERECAQKVEDAEAKVAKILEEGEQQYTDLQARYQTEYAKWQQLQTEVRMLEEIKKRESYEG